MVNDASGFIDRKKDLLVMLSAFKKYIDFILDYKNNFNNSWIESLRFFIGFVVAIIVVDFILDLDWVMGGVAYILLLLLFEFIWVNILFIFKRRT